MEIVRQIYRQNNATPLMSHGLLQQTPLAFLHLAVHNDRAAEHTRGAYLFSGMRSHLGVLSSRDFCRPGFEASAGFFVPPFAEWARRKPALQSRRRKTRLSPPDLVLGSDADRRYKGAR